MTEEDAARIAEKTLEAERVAFAVRQLLDQLFDDGVSPDAILAGAHAEVIAMMTAVLGGPAVAQACKRAIDNVQHMPSALAVALAKMPPAGSA